MKTITYETEIIGHDDKVYNVSCQLSGNLVEDKNEFNQPETYIEGFDVTEIKITGNGKDSELETLNWRMENWFPSLHISWFKRDAYEFLMEQRQMNDIEHFHNEDC